MRVWRGCAHDRAVQAAQVGLTKDRRGARRLSNSQNTRKHKLPPVPLQHFNAPQALSTCRRIIEAFADSVYPPTDQTVEISGNVLKLDAGKHQNRINAYIHTKTESQSRKQRLRQNLSNLFDRVSTGVHSDVGAEEARALFLNTYLFLGEVLHLGRADA